MSADKQDYIAELQNVEYPTKYLLNFLFKCIFPFYKRFKKKDIYYLVLRIPKYLYITHFTFLTQTIFLQGVPKKVLFRKIAKPLIK